MKALKYGPNHEAVNKFILKLREISWFSKIGAGCEIMFADIDPTLNFFRSLMRWFERGHWPCGWEGDYPEGKLIIW